MTRVLKVYRAECFSPNSVERDRAIMDAVGEVLSSRGYVVDGLSETDLTAEAAADVFISMARTPRALAVLKEKEREGCLVVNSPAGVEMCKRSVADRLMRDNNIPAAPLDGADGYWIKRGDEAAQQREDVVFAANEGEKRRILELLCLCREKRCFFWQNPVAKAAKAVNRQTIAKSAAFCSFCTRLLIKQEFPDAKARLSLLFDYFAKSRISLLF